MGRGGGGGWGGVLVSSFVQNWTLLDTELMRRISLLADNGVGYGTERSGQGGPAHSLVEANTSAHASLCSQKAKTASRLDLLIVREYVAQLSRQQDGRARSAKENKRVQHS